MEVKDLVKIEWANQPVLLTKQVAEVYGTTVKSINMNFSNAKEYFIEGEHYFKLVGEDLRRFKRYAKRIGMAEVHPYAAWAYLWTYQGCARHCKMLNTQKAWDVFDMLERFYFAAINPAPEMPAPPAIATTDQNEELITRLQNQFACPCTDLAVVYALLMSNLTVKLGLTKDLTDRIKQIQAETGLKVLLFASTPFMPRDDAAALEVELKEKFSACSLGGEFFDCKFFPLALVLNPHYKFPLLP